MIFVDSNIVIDIMRRTDEWSPWSRRQVARSRGDIVMGTNAVVMAETAGHFSTTKAQVGFFEELGLKVRDLGPAAAYRAGLAHRAYRQAGGARAAILADFLIGGHAVVLGATLLTRDRQRFASYFPELTLITPDTHP